MHSVWNHLLEIQKSKNSAVTAPFLLFLYLQQEDEVRRYVPLFHEYKYSFLPDWE